MRFWDSSALVPLLVSEKGSPGVTAEYRRDPEMLVWWGTEVECVSALSRLEREGGMRGPALSQALHRLDAIAHGWRDVLPTDPLRQTAIRLLRTHAMRAADALQLAAALSAAEGHPETLPFLTLDDRLALAAEREGFATAALPRG